MVKNQSRMRVDCKEQYSKKVGQECSKIKVGRGLTIKNSMVKKFDNIQLLGTRKASQNFLIKFQKN